MNKMVASLSFAACFYRRATGKLTGGATIKDDLIVQAKKVLSWRATVKERLTVQIDGELQATVVAKESLTTAADGKRCRMSKVKVTCKPYLHVQNEDAQ